MALRWWPLVVVGMVALVVCVVVVALVPISALRRSLRPLANVDRLTSLPAYLRAYQIYFLSTIITGVLLVVLFGTALTISARPYGLSSVTEQFNSEHPVDVMVCVGEPVTDSATADLLNYYAGQAKSYGNQRIGLTSPTLRVVPMTRDHQYAADRFESFAKLARLQQESDSGKKLSDADQAALTTGAGKFTQAITYANYAPNVEDNLALCLTGFPSFDAKTTHRRSVVYLGYSPPRAPRDTRAAVFDAAQLKNLADAAGAQIDVIARSDVAGSAPPADQALRSVAESTGGRFALYNRSASARDADPALARILDEIARNPPNVQSSDGKAITSQSWDSPVLPLRVALAVAALLCISLAVLRR